MPAELSLFAAFLVGLSGGLHCIAMCGGISGALGFAASKNSGGQLLFALAYNFGRICSYAFIGLLAGSLLALIDTGNAWLHGLLQLLSSALLIAIGLHITGFAAKLHVLEKWGAGLWRQIQPLALKLFPVTSLPKAFALGLFWGWLPCGLVYSTLAWSATQASAWLSAAMMGAFGLGTLPWLLASTLAGQRVGRLGQSTSLKVALGAGLILLGFYSLYNVLNSQHNAHASEAKRGELHHQHH